MSYRIFRITLLSLSLGAGLLLAPAASAVYKCTGADGKVSYQDRPCADNNAQQSIAVPKSTTSTSSSGPAAGDDSADDFILHLVAQQALLDFCQNDDPATYQSLQQRWRNLHKTRLSQYGNSGRYKELYQRAEEETTEMWTLAGPEMRKHFCKGQAVHMLEQTLS